jgi:hypothetical protein
MKKTLLCLIAWCSGLGAAHPPAPALSLKELPGFSAPTAQLLAKYGVLTDRDLLLVGAVNETGLAEALDAPVDMIKGQIMRLWKARGEWIERWGTDCRKLLTQGSLPADLTRTPLLALTTFPIAKVRVLVEHGIRTAEGLYAKALLEPQFIPETLGNDVPMEDYLQHIRVGAPHVAAAVDRRQARRTASWDLSSLLDRPYPQ